MKDRQVQMKGLVVSDNCRTYSYHVIDTSGDTRQFSVEVPLNLFTSSPLKFQDGPLITRELLVNALNAETPDVLTNGKLNVSEHDIHGYMERHYPPKSWSWNSYRRTSEDGE